MGYDIRILDPAAKKLKRLDKPIAKRVINRIQWLAQHLNDIRPEPLTANLTGFYKLRVGDYRVVYEVLADDRVIMIHMLGHRREVYKV